MKEFQQMDEVPVKEIEPLNHHQEEFFSTGVFIAIGCVTLLLILLSAIFSGAETAFTSMNKVKWKTESTKIKSKKLVKVVYFLLTNMSRTIATVLILNTLANIASSALAGLFFSGIIKTFTSSGQAESIGTGIATGVMTFLILVFAEYLPKNIGLKSPIKFIIFSGWLLYIFYYLFWPFTWILNKIFNRKEKTLKATIEELKSLVDVINHEGTLDSQEALIISKAITFDTIKIQQKMVSWDKVAKINVRTSIRDSIPFFLKTGFSRLVAIDDDGELVGVAHVKKVLPYITNNETGIIKDILLPPFYVKGEDTLFDGLRQMQIQQCHLAIVVDNMFEKNISGIITLENITEELTGQVYDETDLDNDSINDIQHINEHTWKVKTNVNAKLFLSTYIDKDFKVDKDLSIRQFVSSLNKNRPFRDRQLIDHDLMWIEVFKDIKGKKFTFLIEKKVKEN